MQVVAIYENPAAMPRAFVVGHATVVAASDEGAVESLRTIDPRNEILLEADVLPDGPRAAFRPADIVENAANRVCIEVETSRPGYLFLSDV